MKRASCGLVWGIVLAGWLAGVGSSFGAADPNVPQPSIWEDPLIDPFGGVVLTERRIDQFLERLAKTNPGRAGELGALRIAQPQQFRSQIREEMAKRFFQSIRQPSGAEPQPAAAPPPVSPPASPPEQTGDAVQHKHKELIAWLEKNFPQQADELKANPAPSPGRIAELLNRYEPVMRAERDNPPLAAAMKEDITIQMQSDELLMDLQYADEKEREAIIKELNTLTSTRFDLIVRKREIQYEQLRGRLAKLQQDLDKQKSELDKLKGDKEKSIKDRVAELVERTQKTNWN